MLIDALKQRIIFCFWTGDNPMTDQRQACLQSIAKNTHCTVLCITADTLQNWILPEHPLHPAYPYLSAVHKADYLRAYFMCHYGGGYTDIKTASGSWKPAFDLLEQDPNLWIVGYPEADKGCIAYIDDKALYAKMQEVYSKMLGNGSYICRKNTPLCVEWLAQVHSTLDRVSDRLSRYPAPHPRVHSEQDPRYALKWTEICGHIFHPLIYTYLEHTSTRLPIPNFHSYM